MLLSAPGRAACRRRRHVVSARDHAARECGGAEPPCIVAGVADELPIRARHCPQLAVHVVTIARRARQRPAGGGSYCVPRAQCGAGRQRHSRLLGRCAAHAFRAGRAASGARSPPCLCSCAQARYGTAPGPTPVARSRSCKSSIAGSPRAQAAARSSSSRDARHLPCQTSARCPVVMRRPPRLSEGLRARVRNGRERLAPPSARSLEWVATKRTLHYSTCTRLQTAWPLRS